MTDHKTEAALAIFEATESIEMPAYVKDAIQ